MVCSVHFMNDNFTKMITEISEILDQRTGTDYGTTDASVPDLVFRMIKPECF